VSRVVNLGDITRRQRPERAAATRRAAGLPGTVGRSTAASPSLRNSSPASVLRPESGEVAPPVVESDPALTMAPVVKSHRRGLIMLLAVAIVLVLGVIGAVVLLVAT